MAVTIPLQSVPSQTLQIGLGGQNCAISVYQLNEGVFFDLVANGVVIVTAVIAQDANFLVCREYMGFAGNLLFVDTQGTDAPVYTGLGSRFVLGYLDAEEYALVR